MIDNLQKVQRTSAECSSSVCQESVNRIQDIFSSDPFYEGHKKACRSAADVAYKMNMQASGSGKVTIAEKESGCEYAEEDTKGKKKDMIHISQHVENLEKMVEEIDKTIERIFEIIY